MPSRLHIYFWLIAAIAAYWVIAILWFIVFPPEAVKLALARLPPAIRGTIEHRAWAISLVSTAIRALVFLILAWLAAFRRLNWARWTLAILFVLIQAVPLILAARAGAANAFIRGEYLNPQADVVVAVFIIAILLSFTGDARQAFAAKTR